VTSHWGGADSDEKRDWLCGAIADMFPPLGKAVATAGIGENDDDGDAEPDEYDVEETLAQVMQDEFDVAVEDDSIVPIAQQIIQLRASLIQGNFSVVDLLRVRFEQNRDKPVPVTQAQGSDEGGDEKDSDEEMDDADGGVPLHDNNESTVPEPVVDEDGFELVQNRRRR